MRAVHQPSSRPRLAVHYERPAPHRRGMASNEEDQRVAEQETIQAGPLVPVPERPRGLLALDIDGTLLGPQGVLRERTRRAVHAAGEAGWLVTLATGRRWGATKPVADTVGLQVPLICFNGALVRDSATG